METRVLTELRDTCASLFSNQVDQERIAYEVLADKSVIRFAESSKNVWHSIIVEAERQNRLWALFTCPSMRNYLHNPKLIFCELLWLVSEVKWDLSLLKQIYEEVVLVTPALESSVSDLKDVVNILLLIWELNSKPAIVQFAIRLVNRTNHGEVALKLQGWVSKAQDIFRTETQPRPTAKIYQLTEYFESLTTSPINQLQNLAIEQDVKQKIDFWLKNNKIDYNPFAFSNSDRDSRLNEYFFEHDDFEKILGHNSENKNCLIFARSGDGKTATRLRLQTYYRDDDNHAFVFSYLIPQEIRSAPSQSIDGHFQSLLTAAVRHAFVFFALRGMELASLQSQVFVESIAPQLIVFFDEYYVHTDKWQADLQKAVTYSSLVEVLEKLAPVYDDLDRVQTGESVNTEWLLKWLRLLSATSRKSIEPLSLDLDERWSDFRNLMMQVGIKQMIILVDEVRLPSPNGSRNESEYDGVKHIESIIMPLLKALNERLWGEKVYWKFFLPLELYLPLTGPRSPDVPHVILEWDHLRLKKLLEARLSAASNGTITSLRQLVASNIRGDLEKYLCVVSSGSPRHLINNIHKMLAFHITDTSVERIPGKISHMSLSRIR